MVNIELAFEENEVGRLKKKLWKASDEKINKILQNFGEFFECIYGAYGKRKDKI